MSELNTVEWLNKEIEYLKYPLQHQSFPASKADEYNRRIDALQYAIKCVEAVSSAKDVLPEKKYVSDIAFAILSGTTNKNLSDSKEKLENIMKERNKLIDEVEPIVAKLIEEVDKNEKFRKELWKAMEENKNMQEYYDTTTQDEINAINALTKAKQKITELEAQKQSMGRTMWKDQKKISELEADNKDLEKEVIRYKEGG